jgi:hypothetical protein
VKEILMKNQSVNKNNNVEKIVISSLKMTKNKRMNVMKNVVKFKFVKDLQKSNSNVYKTRIANKDVKRDFQKMKSS